MKKNIIGIIAIGVLGGLIASGCTYSKGKSQVVDMAEGIGSQEESVAQQESGSKSTESIVEGGDEAITPPAGQAPNTPPSDQDPTDLPSDVAAGGEGEAEDDASPLAVEAVDATNSRTVYVIFNKPVDAASIVQNDSIQFYGTSDGLMSLKIQGELTPGVNPNVIKFTAKEDFMSSLVHTVKILGADSQDAAKAATDAAKNKLEKEYVRKLLCVDKLLGGEPTDGLLVCQAPPLAVKSTKLLDGNRIIEVTFTKKVDVQAVKQNKSIEFFVNPFVPIPLKGTLLVKQDGIVQNKVIYFQLDESEKEVHVHATGSGFVFAPYTLKVYGLDSSDPSKAVKDASGTAMASEYEHTFICGTDEDSKKVTYVDDCKVF